MTPCVILEGADCVGKTTLSTELRGLFSVGGLEVVELHSVKYSPVHLSIFDADYHRSLRGGAIEVPMYIFDRISLVSGPIYSNAPDAVDAALAAIKHIVEFYKNAAYVVLLTSDGSANRWRERSAKGLELLTKEDDYERVSCMYKELQRLASPLPRVFCYNVSGGIQYLKKIAEWIHSAITSAPKE